MQLFLLWFGDGGTWSEREGLIEKSIPLIYYADMLILFAASITSIISFFKRGHIWVPITKGIVINVIVWLVLLGLIMYAFGSDIKSTIQSILIVGLLALMILQIPKIIKAISE